MRNEKVLLMLDDINVPQSGIANASKLKKELSEIEMIENAKIIGNTVSYSDRCQLQDRVFHFGRLSSLYSGLSRKST